MRLLLAFSLLLTGCSTKGINATLFLKEKDQYLTNLKGDMCIESGQQVLNPIDGEIYRMIHIYSNCDVRLHRRMEDFEPKQWGLPKPKGSLEVK